MDFSQFHFTRPLCLWFLAFIPIIWFLYLYFYRRTYSLARLEKFIDRHLIPHLVINNSFDNASLWKTVLLWSAVWACLVLGIAGPRWNYQEVETFSKDQSLVILLDLSQSMDSKDVRPSRLLRGKQKIEDILSIAKGVKLGLVAFAADPHMIAPLTDDIGTVRHLLPSLETGLVYVQGSRLSSALEMAAKMLEAEPGNNKSILVISDGGFEDSSSISAAKSLSAKEIVIHTIGVGTAEGAPVQDSDGNFLKKSGNIIYSKLEKDKLKEISIAGNGRYFDAGYDDSAEKFILNDLKKRGEAQIDLKHKTRLWEEHFYLLVFPCLPILLYWFRRGGLFVIFFLLAINPASVFSAEVNFEGLFKNSDQRGKDALDHGDYETAISSFEDPYRKGVAQYKAGNFREAEALFRQSSRPEVAASASYNLGNALVQQQKLEEAVKAYETVLEKWPEHQKAKENLDIVKRMLEQQKQQQQQQASSDQNENKQEDQDNSEKEKNDKSRASENGKADERDKEKDNGNEQHPDSKAQNERLESKEPNNESERDEESLPKDSPPAQNSKEDQGGQDSGNIQGKLEESEDQQEAQGMGEKEEQDNNKSALQPKNANPLEDKLLDQWLNQISHDPREFLKKKFYLESKRNGTKEGIDPW